MSSLFQPYPMLHGRRAQAWRYQPAFRRPFHFHEESEFNLITRGRGVIYLGDRKIQVRAGSLVWFPPGLDHYLANASPDLELLTAGFTPELLDAFAREHSFLPNFARCWQQLSERQARELAHTMNEAQSSLDNLSTEQRSLRVLQTLLRLSSPAELRLGHRAASVIAACPATSRDGLARALGSNRGDISRQFHRDHGTTLRKYRNTVRTLEFIRLSENGMTNLARIALEAGFGSYSQCHRVFRALLGVSPREFLTNREHLATFDRFEPMGD